MHSRRYVIYLRDRYSAAKHHHFSTVESDGEATGPNSNNNIANRWKRRGRARKEKCETNSQRRYIIKYKIDFLCWLNFIEQ